MYYDPELVLQIKEEMYNGLTIREAREHYGINDCTLRHWRKAYNEATEKSLAHIAAWEIRYEMLKELVRERRNR
jgi:transposase-like protein